MYLYLQFFFSIPASQYPLIGHITKYNNALYCGGRTYIFAFKRPAIRLNHTYIAICIILYNVYKDILVSICVRVCVCVCVWERWSRARRYFPEEFSIIHESVMPCKCAIYFVLHESRIRQISIFQWTLKYLNDSSWNWNKSFWTGSSPSCVYRYIYTCFIKLFP